jgi:two-component system OmpR family sensor kinase
MAHRDRIMTSLRRRLLLSTAVAVAAVGLVCAAIAYHLVSDETRSLLDDQLTQIARLAARTVDGSEIQGRGDEDIVVSVWGADRKLKFSTATGLGLPLLAGGFQEVPLNGEPYRVYSTLIAGRHIAVAQPVDIRDDQAEAAALAAFLPLLVLMPVLAVVLALVIRAQLQPVRQLAVQVAQRGPFERAGLAAAGLPAEVLPLVDEINRLLARQNTAALRERQFVADAAHALRTPLAALQLQADVLEGAATPAEYAARFADLRSGIRRAAHLSDQLLQVARETPALDAELVPVAIDAALHEVIDLYQPAATAAGSTLRLEADTQATVRADLRRLLLIFGNLVDNALRYTPTGGEVRLRAGRSGASVVVDVCDQGPGIAATELTRVFEPFYRAAGDQGGGSGLGLATVDSLVKELGGHVGLRNREDRSGLQASVTLPLSVA